MAALPGPQQWNSALCVSEKCPQWGSLAENCQERNAKGKGARYCAAQHTSSLRRQWCKSWSCDGAAINHNRLICALVGEQACGGIGGLVKTREKCQHDRKSDHARCWSKHKRGNAAALLLGFLLLIHF